MLVHTGYIGLQAWFNMLTIHEDENQQTVYQIISQTLFSICYNKVKIRHVLFFKYKSGELYNHSYILE